MQRTVFLARKFARTTWSQPTVTLLTILSPLARMISAALALVCIDNSEPLLKRSKALLTYLHSGINTAANHNFLAHDGSKI